MDDYMDKYSAKAAGDSLRIFYDRLNEVKREEGLTELYSEKRLKDVLDEIVKDLSANDVSVEMVEEVSLSKKIAAYKTKIKHAKNFMEKRRLQQEMNQLILNSKANSHK